MLPVRHNFLNLSRYSNGAYCEKSIRHQFSQKIPFVNWFTVAFKGLKRKELIAAFDPSHIKKSGKHTFGKGKYWSGKDQQMKEGIEVSCLSIVDVEDRTAYGMEVVQTPSDREGSLIDHYVSVIKNRLQEVLAYTRYLTVDGYFMKKNFIDALIKEGLVIITKMRQDANLTYLFEGEQKKGKGRKKMYEEKVDVKNIDKSK